jgi:hypothetical protein
MPKATKGTPQEREAAMLALFTKFYSDPANNGKDLSVNKANEDFKKEWGQMLRNKKAYELRASAKAQVAASQVQTGTTTTAQRHAGQVGDEIQIDGTPDQLAWLQNVVLPKLAGAFGGKVAQVNRSYLVMTV